MKKLINIQEIMEKQPVTNKYVEALENAYKQQTPSQLPIEISGFNPLNFELQEINEETQELSPERIGRFTGSSNKKLMTCKSRAKGKSWDNVNWIIDLGDTALRYITEKAIERIINDQAETFENKYTRWGKHYEDEGKAFFQNRHNVVLEDCGFTKFMKNAGATPDGLLREGEIRISDDVVLILSDANKHVFELKCPETVWSSYLLGINGVDESHDYFWQLIGEMLAAETDRFLFCYYDPRFPDNHPSKLKMHTGSLSHVHVNALKARIIIGERLIKSLVETDLTCDVFKELPGAVKDIPTDYADFLEWLSENEKPLLLQP